MGVWYLFRPGISFVLNKFQFKQFSKYFSEDTQDTPKYDVERSVEDPSAWLKTQSSSCMWSCIRQIWGEHRRTFKSRLTSDTIPFVFSVTTKSTRLWRSLKTWEWRRLSSNLISTWRIQEHSSLRLWYSSIMDDTFPIDSRSDHWSIFFFWKGSDSIFLNSSLEFVDRIVLLQ